MRKLCLVRILGGRSIRPNLIVHAEHGWYKSVRDDKFDFFVKLERLLKSKNIDCFVVDANSLRSKRLRKHNHIHLMLGDFAEHGRNTLHVMPTYVWGFWYLDETGVHWNSSIRTATFIPEALDAEPAKHFFNGVSGHMLRENVSKKVQDTRVAGDLPEAGAVVYLQQIDGYKNRIHYLDTAEMVSTVAQTLDGKRVYVKPHPDTTSSELASIRNLCTKFGNIVVSNASIHDLTAASRVVVTQNSAAGFEALMQKKPVITCAKSDYWHATLVAETVGDLERLLPKAEAELTRLSFEKYLYWYLHQQCLEPQAEGFEARVWEKLKDRAGVIN